MESVQNTSVVEKGYFRGNRFKRAFPLMCMTLPFLALVFIFSYLPLKGWLMAFVDYTPGVSVFQSNFAGLKYFTNLFSVGSEFLPALRNTLVMSSLLLITSPVPIALAIMLTEVKSVRFRKTIQTLTSFPNFISWIIVYSLFYAFCSIDDGMLNVILVKMHLIAHPIDILGDNGLTWWLMTFASLWKGTGWCAIIYLSSIAGIDQELYQAAQIDGANRLKRIIHVTIPGIYPTYAVILVLTIGQFLNTGFEQYFTFNNPLVHDHINVLDTYTYFSGIVNLDFSFSTAIGIFKTVVSIFLMFFANLVHKKITGRSVI